MKRSLFPFLLIVLFSFQPPLCAKKRHSKSNRHKKSVPDPLALLPQFDYARSQEVVESDYPYITGSAFRSLCDFCLDSATNNLNPDKVEAGDIIFVSNPSIDAFFVRYRPRIKHPFILLTHHCYDDGDSPTPGPSACHYLEDANLIAWFTVNPSIVHPKLIPLPLGIPNYFSSIGNTAVYDTHIKACAQAVRTKLVYSNFNVATYPHEREFVRNFFADKSFCTTSNSKPQAEYLVDVTQHKFVLSPRGNGLDCYRTWEALLLGSIPVVRSSTLDPLFEGLPVFVIENWQEITEELLEKEYLEIKEKLNEYNFGKLFMPYWISEILAFKFRTKLLLGVEKR